MLESQTLKFVLFKTAKDSILKRYKWYYEYKREFFDYLEVNFKVII